MRPISWDASTRATLALTYRYQTHAVIQTSGTGPMENLISMDENAGILNAALRPTNHWDLNGSAEISYTDNAFTPLGPRQLQHYRMHTMYRPKPWATISGAFNDLERHNNTYNTGTANLDGPLDHVDHSRVVSMGVVLAPNEHYGFDFNYSYSDVYTSTNICYLNGAYAALPRSFLPGAASTTSTSGANLCPSLLTDWGPVKDFMDAPTQYASVALTLSPIKTIPLRFRLSHQRGERQPVLQRCAGSEWVAAVGVPVSVCESCVDGETQIGFGALNTTTMATARAARPAHLSAALATSATADGCSLQLFHVWPVPPG